MKPLAKIPRLLLQQLNLRLLFPLAHADRVLPIGTTSRASTTTTSGTLTAALTLRRRRLTAARTLGTKRGIALLALDAPVLEPDLDLFLGQPQPGGDLDATETGEVHVGGELALKLQELGAGEGRPDALAGQLVVNGVGWGGRRSGRDVQGGWRWG